MPSCGSVLLFEPNVLVIWAAEVEVGKMSLELQGTTWSQSLGPLRCVLNEGRCGVSDGGVMLFKMPFIE